LRSAVTVVFAISGYPVLGKRLLCGGDVELAVADHLADQALKLILGLGIPLRLDRPSWLRSEIGENIGAAEAERNEVVDLVVGGTWG
jgi:hypothetical protein